MEPIKYVPSRVYPCNVTLLPEDILSWQSVNTDKIILPCRATQPMLRTAKEILADHIRYYGDSGVGDIEAVIDNATATLQLLVNCKTIHSSVYLSLHFADGKTKTKWIPDVMGPKYSRPILVEFFRRGGAGLTDENREVWHRYYDKWLDWQRWFYGAYYEDDDVADSDEDDDDEGDEPMPLPRTEAMPYQPDN